MLENTGKKAPNLSFTGVNSRLLRHDDVESLIDRGRAVGLNVQVRGLPDALRRRRVRVDRTCQLAHRNVVLATEEAKNGKDSTRRRRGWLGSRVQQIIGRGS